MDNRINPLISCDFFPLITPNGRTLTNMIGKNNRIKASISHEESKATAEQSIQRVSLHVTCIEYYPTDDALHQYSEFYVIVLRRKSCKLWLNTESYENSSACSITTISKVTATVRPNVINAKVTGRS